MSYLHNLVLLIRGEERAIVRLEEGGGVRDNLSPTAIQASDQKAASVRYEPLVSSLLLRADLKVSDNSRKVIDWARRACSDVIAGRDGRLIVIIGPCSIHDPAQALEYARLLVPLIPTLPDLIIVMRAYFEKPRTSVGWKGLINDPDIDGTYKINKGIRIARKLLCDLTISGCQWLLKYLIRSGARTTESQVHREVASGALHPIGFKNGTHGDIDVAVEAMRAAALPHSFIGTNDHGLVSIVKTTGNSSLQLILRGGKKGPIIIAKTSLKLETLCKDASRHGNAQKDYRNQVKVVKDVCQQIRAGEKSIHGVMIESNIAAGRQDVPAEGRVGLKHGVSITDACVDFETTVQILRDLQNSTADRRATGRRQSLFDEVYLRRTSLSHDLQQFSINPSSSLHQNPATQ
ncbi:hypothetical protein H4Q26_000940 [Puccinia striiformis f. sp. tritici PST-130]|nr:hypothetical protein H4Q26_000940 [Puccinia striiformis f. sp. tritici PST-130]